MSILNWMNGEGEAIPGRRSYTRPPIQEVLIQVAVPPGALTNAAVPGQLYERLRSEYPADVATEVRVPGPSSIAELASAAVRVDQATRHIFTGSAPNKKLILGAERLSANALPPYEGWECLLGRFNRAATALFDARSELEATGLTIRYINRIVIPGDINTDDYFTVPVRTAEEGTAPFANFMLRVQSVLTDDPITCITGFSSADPEDGGTPFMIDIELGTPIGDLDQKDPSTWVAALEDLHRREILEFESMITDDCRRLFD